MSLPEQTRIRLPKLKKGLILGQNIPEIARECHVTERTINRDKEAWLASGDFEVWLRDEWLHYHLLVGKTDPVEAYRQLSKLIGKTFVQRAEIKEKVEVSKHVSETVTLIRRYEEVIEAANNRNLRQNNPQKQVDSPHSNTATN